MDNSEFHPIELEFSKAFNSDIILINAPINPNYISGIIEDIEDNYPFYPNASVFLTTYGGSADDAYRLAKFLQRNYEKFTLYVLGACKSAGTLIALGADEIVMSHHGEFGPLDVQVSKPDHLIPDSSGLDLNQALEDLSGNTFIFFQNYLLQIIENSQGQITTATAAEIAKGLTQSIIDPIASQIDPIRLGEINREVRISIEYGKRLVQRKIQNGIIDREEIQDSIIHLTQSFPSHGFVIDIDEAMGLFDGFIRPMGTLFLEEEPNTELNEAEVKLCGFLHRNFRFPVNPKYDNPILKIKSNCHSDVEEKESKEFANEGDNEDISKAFNEKEEITDKSTDTKNENEKLSVNEKNNGKGVSTGDRRHGRTNN